MTKDGNLFVDLQILNNIVHTAVGYILRVYGQDTIQFSFGEHHVNLPGVLYVRDLSENLISLVELSRAGISRLREGSTITMNYSTDEVAKFVLKDTEKRQVLPASHPSITAGDSSISTTNNEHTLHDASPN